jgi:hypothetical protein
MDGSVSLSALGDLLRLHQGPYPWLVITDLSWTIIQIRLQSRFSRQPDLKKGSLSNVGENRPLLGRVEVGTTQVMG